MKILIIEDDLKAADNLLKGLSKSGHIVEHAADGGSGLDLARTGDFSVLIVDRMLPVLDGLSLVAQLRKEGVKIPVLFLSALNNVDERVKGFKAGGDDYLVKPYAIAELLARVEALSRRGMTDQPLVLLQVHDLKIDLLTREVVRAGQKIDLQPREFRLLEYLMRNAGQVVTRAMLLEHVWNYLFDPQTNVIDVHISRLRAKIDRGFEHAILNTIRGKGFCLCEPE